jgi:hypothetical protein
MDRGILMYETTLGDDAWARIHEIGSADILIGIPSHRNGRTIGEVVRAVAEGIATYFPRQRVVVMNADGGSSDNTTRHVLETPMPENVEKLVTVYVGTMGKGTAIRAIFEAAAALEVQACAVIEARAPGITPQWLPSLIQPILSGHDLAVACYQRSAYSAALSDNLAYPFLRLFYNADLREPLAGEFCIAGDVAADMAGHDIWETDVSRFGINIWLMIQALVENKRVVQVDLGYRGETSGEPGLLQDARLLQTIGTLFRSLSVQRKIWQKELPLQRVPFHGGRCPDRPVPCPACADALLRSFLQGRKHYLEEWRQVLMPSTLGAVEALLAHSAATFEFPLPLWVQVALEFAVVYNRGEGDPDKVAEALLPLFYGRAATYMRQTEGMTPAEREKVVQEIVEAFTAAKPFFLKYWAEYQPW